MLLLVPLACLIVVPMVRTSARPSTRLQRLLAEPWRAVVVMAAVNLCILALTAALFVGLSRLQVSMGILLPMVVGPVLSFVAWTHQGLAMPLKGARRWGAVLAGMSPYLLLTLVAWVWTGSLPESTPANDTFMAWIGGVMLMAVGMGATILGTLVTGLVRERSI